MCVCNIIPCDVAVIHLYDNLGSSGGGLVLYLAAEYSTLSFSILVSSIL